MHAALFIDKTTGDVRLANILPTDSKAGVQLANICVDAMSLNGTISIDVLKRKITGFVGDGAFMCGNEPFK